ncbi:MAG TPA: hypothetical protein PKW75_06960 [candidate division Zixibacteria bacterium]|nr:hypothetical protein [candidate division Zixibacteria bacterium]MDD4918073.1 hypothetical protein [candidate division Zixibacteria bacterium]MDM7973320.1 hypothetical protein [candidate division Zixibacteria bacterium]HOZ08010.1 hypothetical protein [candidate division Zixibacteria bacterium]HPM37409.1 hypothetical protein [candidate division Zixibacteria bacterium]
MAVENPDHEGAARARVEQGRTRLRISVALATSEGARLHLTALLVIWALGAAFAVASLIVRFRPLGPPIVHVAWLAAGLPVLWAYTRFAVGREIISLGRGALTITHRPIPLGFARRYRLANAHRFRVDTAGLRIANVRHRRNPLRWRGEQGMILFDYNLRPVRFGVGLSTAEARRLLQAIRDSGQVSPEQVEL